MPLKSDGHAAAPVRLALGTQNVAVKCYARAAHITAFAEPEFDADEQPGPVHNGAPQSHVKTMCAKAVQHDLLLESLTGRVCSAYGRWKRQIEAYVLPPLDTVIGVRRKWIAFG